jgi:sulfate/thiosulfate transport system substrate-binding protein
LALKRVPWINIAAVLAVVVGGTLIVARNVQGDVSQLLNVSYDQTRELYRRLDDEFAADYLKRTGRQIGIKQSHGGSSRQARAVVDGQLPADVVTLGLYSDIDSLRKRGLIAEGWSKRLPNNSQPYTSTIVFVSAREIRSTSATGRTSSRPMSRLSRPIPRPPATAS